MKTTKEEIIRASLEEFSEKGYEGTLLRDIAEKLGITKSALYKHYESKEALWKAMLDSVESYYDERMSGEILIPSSVSELEKLSLRQIEFTLNDPSVKQIRRLLLIEQYRDERIKRLATKHFNDDIVDMYSMIFSRMMEHGIIKRDDPEMLAFEYVSPISFLIQLSDREHERTEESFKRIEKHIKSFCKGIEL